MAKPPQVSKTLLSIIAGLEIAVVWLVPAHPTISNSYSPLSKPLGIVLRTPITINITVNLIFLSLQNSLVRILVFLLFRIWGLLRRKSSISSKFFCFIFFSFLSLGLVFWLRLGDPLISQSPREFYESHSSERIVHDDDDADHHHHHHLLLESFSHQF